MTTAHRPQRHPAIGSKHVGNYRFFAPKQQFSVRDMAQHTKLKYRQIGQNAPQEISKRDLKRELEEREAIHFKTVDKQQKRAGLISYDKMADDNNNDNTNDNENDIKEFDDSDDDIDSSVSSSDDDDSDDDEAELLRELERIKKEREEQKMKEQMENEEKKREAILAGNPLLAHQTSSASISFNVKRRWDDDVVFKNQARDAVEDRHRKKRFINDTIRSDFHKAFLRRYLK